MANDIALAKSATPIKNGSAITTCSSTGRFSKLNTYVKNTPAIGTIENKYDSRFDDLTYAFLGGLGLTQDKPLNVYPVS